MKEVARKLKKKITETKKIHQKNLAEGSFFLESHEEDVEELRDDFQAYLNGNRTHTLRYYWAFLQELVELPIKLGMKRSLCNQHLEVAPLAQAAQAGYWWLVLGPEITAHYHTEDKKTADIWLRDAYRVISYLILTGHKKEAAEASEVVVGALKTPFLNGGSDWYTHPWFLLQLICRWQNVEVDLEGCDIPSDMGVYNAVLSQWDTTDVETVQVLVNQMASYHMDTARSDRNDDEINDFSQSDFWFFPYEILTWLRIREEMGLPNPEAYEHPLMQQPLAAMPPATPFPKDELLEQVVAKLKADHGLS
ncbi:hypothetical protein [Vibrio sp. V15_P4S5T153]|uniref:hypothetical protein n=1 Tax=Vibrio sp. V15_P4S5T153 TaxID=1938669 RepID=UPI000B8FF695|nr:hypothetical protein [Vibrio sp. V15_P4S5T153]OXX62635.1 hypothetical protein B9J89_07925 [Vibrio sp. V15_P4S5T153]